MENSWSSWFFVGVIAILIFSMYRDKTRVDSLNKIIDSCASSLVKANQEIDSLNLKIADAKVAIWAIDYDSLQEAVNRLEYGSLIDYDCSVPK